MSAAMGFGNIYSSPGEVDKRTEDAARILPEANRSGADYPWKLPGGVCVPGWVLYVSEAIRALHEIEIADKIRKLPKS